MIDEFQDTDNIQYEIFTKLFKDKPLFFIGDPKQSIYKFRGADISAYFKAQSNIDYIDKLTLSTNYRSGNNLIESVNRIFLKKENPFKTDCIKYNKVKADPGKISNLLLNENDTYPTIIFRENFSDVKNKKILIARSIAAEINKLLKDNYTVNSKKIKSNDIAVLVNRNKDIELLSGIFSEYGIKTITTERKSVFSTDTAYNLWLLFQAVENCTSEKIIRSVFLTSFFKNKKDILGNKSDQEIKLKYSTRFRDYKNIWFTKGFTAFFTQFINENDVLENILNFSNGKREITDLFHLTELCNEAFRKKSYTPELLSKWLKKNIDDKTLNEETKQKTDESENSVNILTVHSSKGLQFGIVFIPFFDETSDKQLISLADNTLYLTENEEAGEKYFNEVINENIRLFYVAVTRAKYRNYIYLDNKKSDLCPVNYFLSDYNDDEYVKSEKIIIHKPEITPETYLQLKKNREFTRKVYSNWKISSFTAMAGKISIEDSDIDLPDENLEKETEAEGIFSFPKGARAGLCLHEILENCDFTLETNIEIININLIKYGFDTEFNEIIRNNIEDLRNITLHTGKESFDLSKVENMKRINELEFFFTLKQYNRDDIENTLRSYGSKIKIDRIKGMLHGFIDIVFEYNNKYYIADWKSNHLGNSINDYTYDKLKIAMHKNNYHLQYLIYTIALDKILSDKVKNYEYNTHFGGVFYFFLRGISKNFQNGIYFEKPEYDIIKKLKSILT